jgi:hypothetical protein
MELLSIIANIAQIVSVIWLLVFGSKTLIEAKQSTSTGLPFKIKVTRKLVFTLVLTLAVLILSSSLWLVLHYSPNLSISGTWVNRNQQELSTSTWNLTQSGSSITGSGIYTDSRHIDSSITLNGSINASVVSITEVFSDGCNSDFTLTLSTDGNSMSGNETSPCATVHTAHVSFFRRT